VVPGIRVTTVHVSSDAYVCSVAGELDADSVDELRRELELTAAGSCRRLVLDLVDVTRLDSAGLGLLLAISDRLKRDDGELIVVSDDPRTLRLLDVTGLRRQFRLEQTLADAMDALAPGVAT
jgi:anti-sigma B factor antagonist